MRVVGYSTNRIAVFVRKGKSRLDGSQPCLWGIRNRIYNQADSVEPHLDIQNPYRQSSDGITIFFFFSMTPENHLFPIRAPDISGLALYRCTRYERKPGIFAMEEKRWGDRTPRLYYTLWNSQAERMDITTPGKLK